MADSQDLTFAYLAPEIPALSATFVYEEILGLERRGVRVVPFSVRRAQSQAMGQGGLAARTRILYGAPALLLVIRAAALLPSFGGKVWKALKWLLRDMQSLGWWNAGAWKLAYQWMAGAHLAHWMRDAGCRHLHIHFAHVPAQIGMYASAFSGIPFTVMAHANDIFERGQLLPQKAERAEKLLTISRFNVAHLASLGVRRDRLAVVRCGVSFEVRPTHVDRMEGGVFRLGTLGRLVEKKGMDDLFVALAKLRDGPVAWELDVVGDGPLRAALEVRAGELQIADRIHFKGAMAHGEVASWLRTLNTFVLACRVDSRGDMDGIPVVLMEAMSQGVPVISTRISGIPELVVHEKTGLLAAPADPDDLSSQIVRLMNDRELRDRLASSAVDHVSSEFGQSVNLDRLMQHAVPQQSAASSATGSGTSRV